MRASRIARSQDQPLSANSHKSLRRRSLTAPVPVGKHDFLDSKDKAGDLPSHPRPAWNLSRVTAFPPPRMGSSAASTVSLKDQGYTICGDTRTVSRIQRQVYPLVATIPRLPRSISDGRRSSQPRAMRPAATPAYSDSAYSDGPSRAKSSAAPPSAAVADLSERRQGKGTLFLGVVRPSEPVPSQADFAIQSTLNYSGSIGQVSKHPDAGDFGTTWPDYKIFKMHTDPFPDHFVVTVDLIGDITYNVTSNGRKNIGSASDTNITQGNYRDVVKDLTPSPQNVPPRDHFWAEDLTIKHERFHAAEDVHFGEEGAGIAEGWLNTQRMSKDDDILPLGQQVINMIARHVGVKMAAPGRENRAYADGASSYANRAAAIKTKGDSKGYVSQPPTQQPKQQPKPPAQQPQPPAQQQPRPAQQPAPKTPIPSVVSPK